MYWYTQTRNNVQHDVGYITYTNIIKKLEQYKKKSVIVNTVYISTLRIFIDLRQKDFYQNKKNIIYKNSTSLLNIYKDIFLRSGTLQSESNPFILCHGWKYLKCNILG